MHIRQVGNFTTAFAQSLGCTPALSEQLTQAARRGLEKSLTQRNRARLGDYAEVPVNVGELPILRIDGPFGAPAEDVFDAEIAVLIGTGIGVTPWASVLKEIRQVLTAILFRLSPAS